MPLARFLPFLLDKPAMPPAQLYVVIGDSNVRRNMTQMTMASREAMTTAKVVDCVALSSLAQTLREVPAEATVLLVQSLTSFLVSAEDAGTIFGTIDPVLGEFNTLIRGFATSRHALQVMVAPPMYRASPAWYRRHLPQIAHQFSLVLSASRPKNLHLLSSSVVQDLCPDGVHLTPVAGLHYLLHLFDDAQRVLTALSSKGNYYLSFMV